MTIRQVRPDEYSAVGELTARAFVTGGHLTPGSSYEEVLRDVAGRAAAAEVLVAVDASQVLGTVTVVRPGDPLAQLSGAGELEFRMLAVAPEATGRGVGRALVQAVLDRARTEGSSRVLLTTQDSMTAARRLYLDLGFRRVSELDRALSSGLLLRALELRLE